MLKRLFCAVLLVSFLVGPVYSSSSKDDIKTLIASLKVDIALLRNQIQSYEEQIESLSTVINDLESSNQEMMNISNSDKILLETSKAELETVTKLWTESKEDLKRLKDSLTSLENQVKTWKTISIIAILIAIGEAVIIAIK